MQFKNSYAQLRATEFLLKPLVLLQGRCCLYVENLFKDESTSSVRGLKDEKDYEDENEDEMTDEDEAKSRQMLLDRWRRVSLF